MLTQDLVNLLKSRRFTEAATGILEDPPRLKQVSISHPVFYLLAEYKATHFNSFSGGYYGIDDDEREAIRKQQEVVLSAMIDKGMDMEMLPSLPRNMSNEEEARSQLGLAHTGDNYKSFDNDHATLYVRMAGLGWLRGMEILREKGYRPSPREVDEAIINAVRNEEEPALAQLLDVHDLNSSDKQWYFSSKLLARLFMWSDVRPELVSRLMEVYSGPDTNEWVSNTVKSPKSSDLTSVEWLSLDRGKWKAFHSMLLEKEQDDSKARSFPGLWLPLFRQFVQTGKFASLLSEALSDGCFDSWKNRPQCPGGTNLASWLTQGHAFDFPAPREADYKGDWPPKTPASQTAFAQIRRAVALVRKLQGLGCEVRNGSQYQETEAMTWSSRGFVPNKALVHRHKWLLAPSCNGESAVHSANSVEVALAWEGLGATSSPNMRGEDPWVIGMQASDNPAPWAREIATRLKKKRIAIDASGRDGVALDAISTASPPLARLVLKKSGGAPSLNMLEAALSHNQYGLIREWVDAGHLDAKPELRPCLLAMTTNPPIGLSTAASAAWRAVLKSLRARPDRPWPEQIEAWRSLSESSWNRRYNSNASLFSEGVEVLCDWGPNARQFLGEREWDSLLGMVRSCSFWSEALPVELTPEEGVSLFWSVMLEDGDDATKYSRWSTAQKVWAHFNGSLPIASAGPSCFQKMRELDEAQVSGGFYSVMDGFPQFLEAEELGSMTAGLRGQSRGPGRRL